MNHLGLAQSTVSGHLACLRDCGLVRSRARGRASLYSLARPELLDLFDATESFLEASGERVVLHHTEISARTGHEHDSAHEPHDYDAPDEPTGRTTTRTVDEVGKTGGHGRAVRHRPGLELSHETSERPA